MANRKQKAIIGRTVRVGFPEWDVKGLLAKVDTGAKTSALHVEDLHESTGGWIHFDVVLSRNKPARRVRVRTQLLRKARVRSSSGDYSVRCFVSTRVCIGDVEKDIEISLVSRDKMLHRMLLGREALGKDFLVDVSKHAAPSRTRRRPRAKAKQ